MHAHVLLLQVDERGLVLGCQHSQRSDLVLQRGRVKRAHAALEPPTPPATYYASSWPKTANREDLR
eukprot:9993122-Lingulodinium_polyedra.AAC.1